MKTVPGLAMVVGLMCVCGCATSGPRNRYLQQIQPGTLTNLTAFRSSTNLELRLPMSGRDAFAHATWSPPPSDTTNYQHRFEVLTFDPENRAARRQALASGNRVPIRTPRQWQQLVQEIFAELAPRDAGHGVLLLVQNQEVVLFRDRAGKLTVLKLENKPPEIRVDRTYNDTDFSREAIRLLEAGVNRLEPQQSQFLFITGDDPAFVLIDLHQHLIVFLGYPSDPEARSIPGWFTLRALNSLVIRSFVVTAIKNPFTLVSRGIWHLGNSGAAAISAGSESLRGPIPPLTSGPGMDLSAWEKDLDKLVPERRSQGRVNFYIDGEKFFPALIESIEAATNRVDLSVFIFDTDDYAVKIADLLKRRSSEIRVRVLVDDLGTLFATTAPPHSPVPADFEPPGDIQSYLASGSKVRVRAAFNPWLTVDHRKDIIIDSRLAFVGGMNIGREYRYEWHDMMMGLTGPIVGRLDKDYREAWAHAGPLGDFAYAWAALFDRENPRRNALTNAIDLRPLRTATGRRDIYESQLAAIERARRYIYLENAYFDDDTMLRALIRARRRGVDVRIVLPGHNDSDIMQTSNLVMANELLRNGIRVYIYPGMTHVKAAIYDGWACLGSANLNKMSLRIGQELDVAFSDPATVERLKTGLFDTDFARSHELKDPVPLEWFDFLVKAFANQI